MILALIMTYYFHSHNEPLYAIACGVLATSEFAQTFSLLKSVLKVGIEKHTKAKLKEN
jgi:hypothetical protein